MPASSVLTTPNIPGLSKLPTSPIPLIDTPLESESDDDPEGVEDSGTDAEEDVEGHVDDDNMFADD